MVPLCRYYTYVCLRFLHRTRKTAFDTYPSEWRNGRNYSPLYSSLHFTLHTFTVRNDRYLGANFKNQRRNNALKFDTFKQFYRFSGHGHSSFCHTSFRRIYKRDILQNAYCKLFVHHSIDAIFKCDGHWVCWTRICTYNCLANCAHYFECCIFR